MCPLSKIMSNQISESEATKADASGVLLGELSPSREMKGAFYRVFLYNGELIAVAYSDVVDCWIIGGEKITREQLPAYVDDGDAALAKLNSLSS